MNTFAITCFAVAAFAVTLINAISPNEAKFISGNSASLGSPPSGCDDDNIGPGGFPTTRDETTDHNNAASIYDWTSNCCPWKSTDITVAAWLGISACTWKSGATSGAPSSLSTGQVVCTKGHVEHPHNTRKGVGILAYKRTKCNSGGTSCANFRQGICLDLSFCGTIPAARVTQSECVAAAAAVINGVSTSNGLTVGSWDFVPAGCSASGTDVHYNTNTAAGKNGDGSWTAICQKADGSYFKAGANTDTRYWFGAENGGVNIDMNAVDGFAAKAITAMSNLPRADWPYCTGDDMKVAVMRMAQL